MRSKEFHPLELALPVVFLFAVYVVLFSGYSPITGPKLSSRYAFERAKLLMRRGNYSQALKYIEQLTHDFPTNHVYWAQKADLFHRLGQPLDEAHALEQILVYSSVPDEACPRLGQAYEEAGDGKKGLDAFRRCLSLEPKNADFHFFLGHAEERRGDLDSAAAEYLGCLASAPHYLDCSVGRARILLRKGDAEAAAGLMAALNNVDLEASADALMVRALINRRLGRRELAMKDLVKATAVAPEYSDVWTERGSLEIDMGDTTSGNESLRHAASLNAKVAQ
jgi:tetratricopeptide (TPR) repeat protein